MIAVVGTIRRHPVAITPHLYQLRDSVISPRIFLGCRYLNFEKLVNYINLGPGIESRVRVRNKEMSKGGKTSIVNILHPNYSRKLFCIF